MGRKITLRDVAEAANVSVSTVSRVIHRNPDVSPELRDRANEAARRLGVNLHERNRAKTIAFLLGNRDRLHPFHSRVLVGTEGYCAKHGYSTLFLSFQYSTTVPWRDLSLPQLLEGRQDISGIVAGGTHSPALLELLSHRRIPFAVLGNNVLSAWQHKNYDVVWLDDVRGAHSMTRYLQFLGHRAIGFVGNCQQPWVSRSYEGYRLAMSEASLGPRMGTVESDEEQEVGYLGTKSLLASGEPVSGILTADDPTAQGAYRAVKDHGLRIPDDLSLASLGETDAGALDPPLTTVQEFPDQVGKELAKLVLNRIAHPDVAPQSSIIPTRLVKRASCCPPRPIGLEKPREANISPGYF
ncbi:MAG: LacI family DNA-binding transcriptional regulator [Terriglobia bacterium]